MQGAVQHLRGPQGSTKLEKNGWGALQGSKVAGAGWRGRRVVGKVKLSVAVREGGIVRERSLQYRAVRLPVAEGLGWLGGGRRQRQPPR